MRRSRGFGWLEVVIVVGLVAAAWFGVNTYLNSVEQRGYDRAVVVYEKKLADQKKVHDDAIDKQKKDAARVLAQETAQALAREAELLASKDKLERDNAKLQNRINDQVRVARNLIAASGGLRDPGASTGRGSGSGSAEGKDTGSSGSNPERGGGARLSGEATEFLLGEAASCNAVVERMRTCRKWVNEITKGRAP